MIKLLYDFKCTFKDQSIVLKDREYDITWALESLTEDPSEPGLVLNSIEEKLFYDSYKDYPESLVGLLEACYELPAIQEKVVSEAMALYPQYSQDAGSVPTCEFTNWRLIFDPLRRSISLYSSACTAEDVMERLDINKRQLKHYIKTCQIREVLHPDDDSLVRYNPLDVELLQYKLGKGDFVK